MINKFNLYEKFSQFDDFWSPRIAGELNGQHVKLVKLKGEFVWHKHVDEDELFYVLLGKLFIDFRDQEMTLVEGDCLIIPRGIEHRPRADDEVHVLLFEPVGTINTGDVSSKLTRLDLPNVS